MSQGGKPSFITGGRALVFPCIQTVQRIPLNTMTLEVHSPRVYTIQGVPISVIGTAQVKINGSNEKMLEFAAEQFGGEFSNTVHSLKFGSNAMRYLKGSHLTTSSKSALRPWRAIKDQ